MPSRFASFVAKSFFVIAFANSLVKPTWGQNATFVERAIESQMLGTISVSAMPSFSGGQLFGCTLLFTALAQDWAYKSGGFIKVEGSLGIVSVKGKAATTLKVALNDLDLHTGTLTPSAPASAYFVSGNSTTKDSIVGSTASDTPGSIFVVQQLFPTYKILAQGLASNRVTIAFARKKGGTDIQVNIDTSVIKTEANGRRIRSEKPTHDFLECIDTLIKNMKGP